MQLLAFPGFLAFFVVSLWVGIRLLLLWSRTRETPELLMGIGVLGIGPLGFGIAMAAFLSAGASPLLAQVLVAAASLTIGAGVAAKYVFNWRIYHPTSRVARGVALGAIAAMAATIVAAGFTNHFAPAAWQQSGTSQVRQVIQVGALWWGAAEAFLWHRRMRRRLAIGLGDPLVANRFLLWGLGAGFAGLGSAVGGAVAAITGQTFIEQPALTLALSLFGLASAGALWLAFVPPASYVAWLRTNA